MAITFSVTNFERFQHYKDRTPPWIKLYNELLDDYEFGLLPDATKAHLLAIWLLASRYNNEVPADADWIARKVSATTIVDLTLLEKAGFIKFNQLCSEPLASRKQNDLPEKEKEEETERETETEKRLSETSCSDPPSPRKSKRRQAYSEQFEEFWRAYPTDPNMAKLKAFEQWKRLAPDQQDSAIKAVPAFRRYCEDNAKTGYRPVHAERFLSQHRFDGFLNASANGAGGGDPELARLQADAARKREEKNGVPTTH